MYTEHHYLGGNNSCRGCGSSVAVHQAVNALYATIPNVLVFGGS